MPAHKAYKTSWGERIDGLAKTYDGRWRIISTGERFSEKDEYKAVARFKASIGTNRETVMVPIASGYEGGNANGNDPLLEATLGLDEEGMVALVQQHDEETGLISVGHLVDKKAYYEMVRREIIASPELMAERLRIPQMASLISLKAPAEPISLDELERVYLKESPSKPKSKQEALNPWKAMRKFINAKTLADLTTENLERWKASIEKTIPSPGTRTGYYGRVKTIVGFGLKVGIDAEQIGRALLNCKVLWTKELPRAVDPQPISREDFHKLLEVGGEYWKPWLLIGLNFCMHLQEVCDIQYTELNMDAGTYASIRGKTAVKRIPRAATIWPETMAAIKAVKRRGQSPYLFTSSHGTKYNRNTLGNHFKELTIKAKVTHITFDALRDGAYTAAITTPGVDEKFARVLAGHKSAGLQDSYVLRHPSIVKVACDAVHNFYFG